MDSTRAEATPCESDGLQLSREDAAAVELRQSERYHIMADAMPQIVWAGNPDGSRDYFNQRWHEHTGIGLSEAKGWGWLAALHPEDAPRCRATWSDAVANRDDFEIEYRLLCVEDGSYRWNIERALPVFGPDGDVIKWYGTCTDVDDLKKAQAEIDDLNARLRRAMT